MQFGEIKSYIVICLIASFSLAGCSKEMTPEEKRQAAANAVGHDMSRQRALERAGWIFWRCFASTWVLRKDEVFGELLERLTAMGIAPLGAIDRAPNLVDKRIWQPPAVKDDQGDEVQLAIETAVAAAK